MRLNVSVSQFCLSAGTRPEICEPSQPTWTSGCDQKSAYLSAASFCCDEFEISTAAVGVRMLAAGLANPVGFGWRGNNVEPTGKSAGALSPVWNAPMYDRHAHIAALPWKNSVPELAKFVSVTPCGTDLSLTRSVYNCSASTNPASLIITFLPVSSSQRPPLAYAMPSKVLASLVSTATEMVMPATSPLVIFLAASRTSSQFSGTLATPASFI